MLSDYQMYQICNENDHTYDSRFYMAVRTTGIYCIPSCRARMPLFENVEFFPTREDAISSGYRGCKRCNSEFYPNDPWIDRIKEYFVGIVDRKIRMEELEQLVNMSASTINRRFKDYTGVSPMRYHRRIRIEYAHSLLLKGMNLIDACHHSGYSSLSGFISSYRLYYDREEINA